MSENQKRGKSKIIMLLVIVLLFSVFTNNVFAQSSSQLIQSIGKFGFLFDIYKVQGYATDSMGNQIPVYDSQYEGFRLVVDFFALFIIFIGMFMMNKQIKDKIGKRTILVIAFVLSVSFVAGSRMFVGSLIPLMHPWAYLVAGIVGIYYGLFLMIGGTNSGPGLKFLLLILAAALASLIFFSIFNVGIDIPFLPKLGGQSSGETIDYFGSGNDLSRTAITGGSGIETSTGTAAPATVTTTPTTQPAQQPAQQPSAPATQTRPSTPRPVAPAFICGTADAFDQEMLRLYQVGFIDKTKLVNARNYWKQYNEKCSNEPTFKKPLASWDKSLKDQGY